MGKRCRVEILGQRLKRAASSGVANWAGNIVYQAAGIHAPSSIDDLRRVVEAYPRVRACGYGHSFSSIADTPGHLVRLNDMPRVLRLDTTNSTVTVDAGATYGELIELLHRQGVALANLASISDVSIGGACVTGTHGSGDSQQILGASVVAMEVVGPDGDLVDLRLGDDPTFAGSVVSLGSLGIITQVTLKVEPAFDMTQHMLVEAPLVAVTEHMSTVFASGYSVSVFTRWDGPEATVAVKRRVDQETGPWPVGKPATEQLNPVPARPAELCTRQLGVPGPWFERLPHFIPMTSEGDELQSELFLPREAGSKAMALLQEIGDRLAPVLLISEIRSVMADDLWLSPAYGRDSYAFHFTWIRDDVAVLPALAAVEERLAPLGARPHWGKLTTLTPQGVLATYERAADFERLMVERDPTGKFRNEFITSYFPTSSS